MKSTSLLLASLLATAACSDKAQIILAIDTSVGVPCTIDAIKITATGSEASSVTRELAGTVFPLAVTLEDATDGGFQLVVAGMKGDEEVLRAEGSLQFGQASGDALAAEIVLEPTCTPDAPCALPALTPYVAPPSPVTQANCGEMVRRYTPAVAAETYRDACTVPGANAGKVLMGTTDQIAEIPLSAEVLAGFSFEFYGQPLSKLWASKNGYLSFAAENPDPSNDLDPGAFDRDLTGMGVPPPPRTVFPFWDQLTKGADGICYALEGNPGTQKLRVTWKNTCHVQQCTGITNNFTVVLDERNNRVSFTYGDMLGVPADRALGSTATVGIVDRAQGCPVSECTYATGLCADGVTACGYSQSFSKMPQDPKVPNVQFDPVLAADE